MSPVKTAEEIREYNRLKTKRLRIKWGIKPRQSLEQRFWSKVNKTESCWLWNAKIEYGGYGIFWFNKKNVKAHRFSYEFIKGKIPIGLTIDHLCRIRHCVNPNHLEPVSLKENVFRSENFVAKNVKKTHCDRGHAFTPENTILSIRSGNRKRTCRTCKVNKSKERQSTEDFKIKDKKYRIDNREHLNYEARRRYNFNK